MSHPMNRPATRLYSQSRSDASFFRKLWGAFLICPYPVGLAVLGVLTLWTMLGVLTGLLANQGRCHHERHQNGTNETVYS